MVLQPVGELVLAIRCLERRQRGCLPALLERASRQVGDRFELVGGELAANHHPDLLPHLGHHVSQPRGSAHDSRDRIVQLVGEAGGHRAERDEPLVAGDRVPRRVPLDLAPRQQVSRHREPFLHRMAPVGGGQLEQPALGDRPRRARVELRDAAVRQVRVERARIGAAIVGAEQLDLAPLHAAQHGERPRKQHEEARGERAFGVDRAPGRILDDATAPGEPHELVVAEMLEEKQGPQLVRRQPFGFGHRCSRYVWRSWIAIAPSPTAEATRLIELARTSPAANTPGVLASR